MRRKKLFGAALAVALFGLLAIVSSQYNSTVVAFDRTTCKNGCLKDLEACRSQTPATDAEREKERKKACLERFNRCDGNCGP